MKYSAQLDWGLLGTLDIDGREHAMWGFMFTLGYSRMMMAEAALNQMLGTLLRMRCKADTISSETVEGDGKPNPKASK